jgi:hypothetical protein
MRPNLIVIGAMKCGTSALHQYLSLHPDVFMSHEKELDFFIADRNWTKGVGWYESMFPSEAAVRGESSPDYTNYPTLPGVPEKMHAIVPDAKLIYMVRDPVERIVSQYIHNRWTGIETRPLSEALTSTNGSRMDDTRYIRRSKYFMQLQQYLPYFSKSNMLVLTQEDLFQRRQATLQRIFRFLGVDDRFESEGFGRLIHESNVKDTKNWLGLALARGRERGILQRLPASVREPASRVVRSLVTTKVKKPALDDQTRKQIVAILSEDLEQFKAFTATDFTEWSSLQ